LKIVLQRVKRARVLVADEVIGQIEKGFLVLVGIYKEDTEKQAAYLADKCAELRGFEDNLGKMNLSLLDIAGQALAVSQFTLCADVSRGRRPSFDDAMEPVEAKWLFDIFCSLLIEKGIDVQTGRFGAKMAVELVNDGPVTFVIEN
jgi:D-aminoacyl-tRNA deacylase